MANETIEFILPAEYGLGGLDPYFGKPEDYGHHDRRFSTMTDSNGEFRYNVGRTVYHVTMFLIPPLGALPRRPPAPFLLVRVRRYADEYYAVQTWNGRFKAYTTDAHELPLEQASLVQLEARSIKDEKVNGRATVALLALRYSASK